MDRREMLGMLGAGGRRPGRPVRPRGPRPGASAKLDAVHKECLEACSDCAKSCDMAFHHCTIAGGRREA